jgi:hypothetical protein
MTSGQRTGQGSFARQRQYIALCGLKKEVLDGFRSALPGSRIGKGWIRSAKPDRIDLEVLEQLLRRTAESKSAP